VLFCDGHAKSERPEQTAGANGQINMWGAFTDSNNSTSCHGAWTWPNSLNCDGYSAGATHNLELLTKKWE
jgi:hypothetical protein